MYVSLWGSRKIAKNAQMVCIPGYMKQCLSVSVSVCQNIAVEGPYDFLKSQMYHTSKQIAAMNQFIHVSCSRWSERKLKMKSVILQPRMNDVIRYIDETQFIQAINQPRLFYQYEHLIVLLNLQYDYTGSVYFKATLQHIIICGKQCFYSLC